MVKMSQQINIPFLETPQAKFWFLEQGIIYKKINQDVEQSLEDALFDVKKLKEAIDGAMTPLLVDIRFMKSISVEAREYYSGEEAAKNHTACAILIDNWVSKIIGNFFMGLNKPGVPTRLFTNIDKAVDWLKNYTEPNTYQSKQED